MPRNALLLRCEVPHPKVRVDHLGARFVDLPGETGLRWSVKIHGLPVHYNYHPSVLLAGEKQTSSCNRYL